MFDALNGHFGDDVEWGMAAYLPIIIIRCSPVNTPKNLIELIGFNSLSLMANGGIFNGISV